MNELMSKFCLAALVLGLGCTETPTQFEQPELREDFSEAEFKEAIIGKWQSVYEKPGQENVEYLELGQQGNAKAIIVQNDSRREFEGNYAVSFLRPPTKEVVTFAELTISMPGGDLKLSKVNFGLHNAFPVESGLFLRIDEAPYGVLRRAS